jgi:hypothetical protein
VATEPSPAAVEPAPVERRSRRRSVLAGITLVLACLAILVATVAVWSHQVAFNTERFTALASDALDDPEVIEPLSARISAQVVEALDVQSRLEDVLPDQMSAIAGPVTLALQDGLTRRLETRLAEPEMQEALTQALALAHELVMNLLRDQAPAVTDLDGQVVIEVYPALLVALQELQAAGIIAADVQLPDPATSEPPGVIRGVLENLFGVTLPADFGTIPIMSVEQLQTAQTVVKAFDIIVIVLIVLAVALSVLAIWLAARRPRMVVFLAIGTVVAFLLARLLTNAATDALTTAIAAEGLRGAVRSILDATLADFRGWAFLILIALGIVAVAAWFWSRPATARRVSLPELRTERGIERIGLALIALVVLWVAVGLEVAILAAVLIVALELILQSRAEASAATRGGTSRTSAPLRVESD